MTNTYHQKNIKSIFASLLFLSALIQSSAVFASPGRAGPYVGAYVGGGFGSNEASTEVGTVKNTSYFATPADIEAVNNAASWSDNPNTVIGGIQVGHDWVWKQFVYGLALDYGSLTFDSSENVTMPYPENVDTYSVDTSMSTDWLFTLRGRLGYQTKWRWPNFLYVTGGMAITNLEVTNSFTDNSSLAGSGESSTASNQIGWTAGVGIELAAFEQVSVGLEYSYVKIPSVTTTGSISNSAAGFGIPANSLTSDFSTTGDFSANLLKIVINYRFNE